MRRTAPTLPVPPKLLKHFAAATIVITLLLAVFASGEDWGAEAQLKAVESKNQLLKSEVEKLGSTKLVNKLKLANGAGAAKPNIYSDADIGPEEIAPAPTSVYPQGSEVGRSFAQQPAPRISGDREYIPDLPQRPGASITVKGMNVDALPNADPAKRKRKAAESSGAGFPPQFEAAREGSRPRPGVTFNNGE